MTNDNPWRLVASDEVTDWIEGLSAEDAEVVTVVLLRLHVLGPAMAEPYARTVGAGGQLREVQFPLGSHPRILYGFDGDRTALLLVVGDRTSGYQDWYRGNAHEPGSVRRAEEGLARYKADRIGKAMSGSDSSTTARGLPPLVDLGVTMDLARPLSATTRATASGATSSDSPKKGK